LPGPLVVACGEQAEVNITASIATMSPTFMLHPRRVENGRGNRDRQSNDQHALRITRVLDERLQNKFPTRTICCSGQRCRKTVLFSESKKRVGFMRQRQTRRRQMYLKPINSNSQTPVSRLRLESQQKNRPQGRPEKSTKAIPKLRRPLPPPPAPRGQANETERGEGDARWLGHGHIHLSELDARRTTTIDLPRSTTWSGEFLCSAMGDCQLWPSNG
jgi:hypothetical protein